ncbi:suppressor protein Mpt5p [[Candida] railenensis]|uniref:Suppressor protein Mpt5p n=1 Tax=[Candida] railenensis TaxID=45579 RepID=A0A9P0QVL8_9ASCO|nr:suppressor protein Mpt5p [[Candida] railenensis]
MPAHSHSHNLSINSISSIIEPTTPPSLQNHPNYHQHQNSNSHSQKHKRSHSNLWDHPIIPQYQGNNNGNHNGNIHKNSDITLPSFDDNSLSPLHVNNNSVSNNNKQDLNVSSSTLDKLHAVLDKENFPVHTVTKTPPLRSSSVSSSSYNNSNGNGNGNGSAAGSSSEKIDKEYLTTLNKIPLCDLKHEVLKLSKDQYGCRFLQKKIDENTISNYSVRLENFEIIFKEIYPNFYELIIDPFGNYLIQKLISYCDEGKLNMILEILQFNLFQISINQHGTRALQKIIDSLNNDYQLSLLIKGLKPYIIELIKDLNGNHVIQKILNKFSPQNCQFIYESILRDLIVVATHKHGCCVLQKCLNHVTDEQLYEFARSILKFQNFYKLINDQFGNYVLQYLISINSIDINYRVFDGFVKFGIDNLCNLKFSSNVIEKFLKNCFMNENQQKFAAKRKNSHQKSISQSSQQQFAANSILSGTGTAGSAPKFATISANSTGSNFSQPSSSELSNLLDNLNIGNNEATDNSRTDLTFTDLKYDLIYHILTSDLNKLINDPYGNYVIQTLIDVLTNEFPSAKLQLLVAYSGSTETIQIQVIKKWFANCKIVSSFGKRIQSKINSILNNSATGTTGAASLNHGSNPGMNYAKASNAKMGYNNNNPTIPHQLNMNANGEFISNQGPSYNSSVRSLSLDSVPPINNTGHQRAGSTSSFQPNYTFLQNNPYAQQSQQSQQSQYPVQYSSKQQQQQQPQSSNQQSSQPMNFSYYQYHSNPNANTHLSGGNFPSSDSGQALTPNQSTNFSNFSQASNQKMNTYNDFLIQSIPQYAIPPNYYQTQ